MTAFGMFDCVDNAPDLWRDILPVPTAASHKYSRGTALVRGGDIMPGAARLAARAAQRMGAGLVTIAAPAKALPIYAAALESVIVRPADRMEEWRALMEDAHHPALLIGPGLAASDNTIDETQAMLEFQRPCVVDAGALTSFGHVPQQLFGLLHPACVLTPHEGEFAQLFGPLDADPTGDRIGRARAAARKAGCVILLKGAETVIASPDGQTIINRNAPPWLATAGSGDVLAGMITGLIAQKMPVFQAAAAAAWFHGHSAARHGAGLIAEDIVDGIPHVWAEIHF